MKKNVLIVEDQFVEANDLQLMLRKAGFKICGIARTADIAEEMIKNNEPELVLLDIFLKGKRTGIDIAKHLKEKNIPFIYLSANSNEAVLNAAKATQPYGFLVKPFREKDVLVTIEIALYRHEHSTEAAMRKEDLLKEKLLAIAKSKDSWQNKMFAVSTTLKPHISFDYFTAGFNRIKDTSTKAISFFRIGYEEYQTIGIAELLTVSGLKINDLLTTVQNTSYDSMPDVVTEKAFEEACSKPALTRLFFEIFHVSSFIYFPLKLSNGDPFILCFYCKRADTYTTGHIGLMNRLQSTMATVIETILEPKTNITVFERNVTRVPSQVGNGPESQDFEGIIGNSRLLRNVFDQITQVAPFETSVLILGESGTGKERIANCIHNGSPRKDKPLVKVNCAALPPTLIESELFGHEKGSYTGATEKRKGKFEQANGGTIFLDEIGEMPVDLQVKLLRVLQEKEIEPVGSQSSVKINVRVIAATNRNLEKEVSDGRFRLDLYYRLNVFPIDMPSLRERPEDIPALADHFISYYNQKAGKSITGVSDNVMKDLLNYSWPGNIRELENLIERSVLLAKGSIIDEIPMSAAQKKNSTINISQSTAKTIEENERDYIITVLTKCGGRIWGAGGAAEILNLPPTTLTSKMKKLGIRK